MAKQNSAATAAKKQTVIKPTQEEQGRDTYRVKIADYPAIAQAREAQKAWARDMASRLQSIRENGPSEKGLGDLFSLMADTETGRREGFEALMSAAKSSGVLPESATLENTNINVTDDADTVVFHTRNADYVEPDPDEMRADDDGMPFPSFQPAYLH